MPEFDDRWLTMQEAARHLGVTVDSIRRYVRRDGMTVLLGRVRLSELLEVEKAARARKGGRGQYTPGRTRVVAERYCSDRSLDDAAKRMLFDFAKHLDQSFV